MGTNRSTSTEPNHPPQRHRVSDSTQVFLTIAWLLVVGAAWLVARIYASYQWEGGSYWTATWEQSPHYGTIVLAINLIAPLAAFGAPALVALRRRRR